MNPNNTTEQHDELVEDIFLYVIETQFDDLIYDCNSDDITIICARLAARFATYAGDAANW